MKRMYCVAIVATALVNCSAFADEGDHILSLKATVEPALRLTQTDGRPLSSDFKIVHDRNKGMLTQTIPITITNNLPNQDKIKFNLKVNEDPTLGVAAGGDDTPRIQLEVKLGDTTLKNDGEDFELERAVAANVALQIIPTHEPDLPAGDYEGIVIVTLAPATI